MSWVTDIPTMIELWEAEANLSAEIGKHDKHEQTYRDMLAELKEEIARRQSEPEG